MDRYDSMPLHELDALARDRHGVARFIHGWLVGPSAESTKAGAEESRHTARRFLESRGWTLEQVARYCTNPELYLPASSSMGPQNKPKRRFAERGAQDNTQHRAACAAICRALEERMRQPASVEEAARWSAEIQRKLRRIAPVEVTENQHA